MSVPKDDFKPHLLPVFIFRNYEPSNIDVSTVCVTMATAKLHLLSLPCDRSAAVQLVHSAGSRDTDDLDQAMDQWTVAEFPVSNWIAIIFEDIYILMFV